LASHADSVLVQAKANLLAGVYKDVFLEHDGEMGFYKLVEPMELIKIDFRDHDGIHVRQLMLPAFTSVPACFTKVGIHLLKSAVYRICFEEIDFVVWLHGAET